MSELRDIIKPIGDPEIHESKTGTGMDYIEVRSDGTVRLKGLATSWKDMVADLFSRKLNSNTGKVDYDWDENSIIFKSGGSLSNTADIVQGNSQVNHEFKVGNGIIFKPHFHWFQDVSSGVAKAITLSLKYRIQRNGHSSNSSWTTIVSNTGVGGDDIWDFTSEVDGTYNQISIFPDMVFDCSVSDTIQFQIARTDNNSGDALIYFLDIHGEVDAFGSDEVITKTD